MSTRRRFYIVDPMGLSTPRTDEWVVAVLIGTFVAFSLWSVTSWAGLIAVATTVILLAARQRPLTCVAILAFLQLYYPLLGVPSENPAALVPTVAALYSLGRNSRMAARSIVVVTLFILFLTFTVGFTLANLLFNILVMGGTFLFGRMVGRRAVAARASAAEAAALTTTDLAGFTTRLVADERARLGGQALGIIRSSVEAMRRDADAAVASLDPSVIQGIADGGRDAIAELRWLLGLLRTNPAVDVAPASPPLRIWPRDVGLVIVLLALTMGDGFLTSTHHPVPMGWALIAALPLTLLFRRRYPLPATLAAAIVVGLVAVIGEPLFIGIGAGAIVTLGLLSWSAGIRGELASWLGLSLLGVTTVLPAATADAGNFPILLALFGLPALAGHEWGARDREGRHAQARVDHLQTQLDATVMEAVRAERLRIARALHDVTSQAVAVMVLQATAALTLRDTDPEAAKRSLRAVHTAGSQALAELGTLFALLDAGAIGAPGLAGADRSTIETLVSRMRAAGLDIDLVTPPGMAVILTDVTHGVVQESLTNVARHAPSARVRVEYQQDDGFHEVVVTNDAPVTADVAVPGSGFGLAGLAERVRSVGGEFSAGPLAAGGYEVRARIPGHASTRHPLSALEVQS